MNKILAAGFFVFITALLMATRFGYEKPLTASVEFFSQGNPSTRVLARGDTIETDDYENALIRIEQNIFIALDERTTVSIERIFPSLVEIKIIRGRLLAQTSDETEKLVISSPETSDFITSGSITAVRYDWLGQTEITPFENFSWENSSAKLFYQWAVEITR